MVNCKRCSVEDALYETINNKIEYLGLCKSPLHPNIVTLCGLCLCWPLYQQLQNKNLFMTFIIISFRYYLDSFDGALARKCKKSSLMDTISDSIGVTLIWYFVVHNVLSFKTINMSVMILILALQLSSVFLVTDAATHKSEYEWINICRDNLHLFLLLQYIIWVLSVHYF